MGRRNKKRYLEKKKSKEKYLVYFLGSILFISCLVIIYAGFSQ